MPGRPRPRAGSSEPGGRSRIACARSCGAERSPTSTARTRCWPTSCPASTAASRCRRPARCPPGARCRPAWTSATCSPSAGGARSAPTAASASRVRLLQLPPGAGGRSLAGRRVEVELRLDGRLLVLADGRMLAAVPAPPEPRRLRELRVLDPKGPTPEPTQPERRLSSEGRPPLEPAGARCPRPTSTDRF